MKIRLFRKVAGSFVFGCLVLHALLGVTGMLSSALPLKFRVGFLLAAGLVAFLSTVTPALLGWNGRMPAATLFLVLLVFSLIVVVGLQHLYIEDMVDGLGRSALGITRGILLLGLSWMLCGAPVQGLRREQSIALPLSIMVFLSFAVLSNLNGGIFVSYGKLSEGRSDGIELNHLVVGESASFLLLLAYAFITYRWRLLIFVLSTAILFSLGGRSALFSYLFAVGMHFYLNVPVGRKWTHLLGMFAVLVVFVSIYLLFDLKDDTVTRMLFSQGISVDGSVVERQDGFFRGLKALPSQILIGDPAFLIRTFRSMGTYIHNLLSAWQFFGLLPFLMFVSALVWVAFYIFKNRQKMDGPIDDFGILIFLYSGVSILTAKYIGFQMFWFGIGFWLFRMSVRKNNI
jgi:hypothetical protein